MELVTHAPAAMLEQDQATGLLLEMAAVTRTIFGVRRPADVAQPAPVVEVVTTAPSPQVPSLSLPVPALAVPAVPLPARDHGDPEERHSLALLHEIAFLDE